MATQPDQPASDYHYWAFISYSHADEKWANWLHKALETYGVPKVLVGKPSKHGPVPKRAFPVFRDSIGNVLSMPHIINSHNVGQVMLSDKDLFVEVSGHYWPTVSVILDILAYLFSDMKGGVHEVHVNYSHENTPRITPELGKITQTLDVDLVNQTLGTEFNTKQIAELAERMMYSVTKSNPKQLALETPAFRVDVLHPLDVVDDIARAYGFDNLTPLNVNVSTRGGILPQTRLNDDIRNCMVGLGFQEVLTWILTSNEHHFTAFERAESPHVKLGVVKEQGLTMVRNALYPETMRALLANRSKKAPFKLFELDQVVDIHKNSETGTVTHYKLCMISAHANATFDEMKGNVESLAKFLGEKSTFSPAVVSGFIEGRTANVNIGPHHGFFGEMHPSVLSRLSIGLPAVVFEIYLTR